MFLALHGGQGEDGTIQALLDLAGVPYTGSGHLASALAMDKDLSKHLSARPACRPPTGSWRRRRSERSRSDAWLSGDRQAIEAGIDGRPYRIVKNARGACSRRSTRRSSYDDEVMIEQFIAGRELTVGILGDEALPVGEIIPKHEIYDYECKYTAGMADEDFPAS